MAPLFYLIYQKIDDNTDRKKGKYIVITMKNSILIFLFLISLMFFTFNFSFNVNASDDYKNHEISDRLFKFENDRHHDKVRMDRQFKRKDGGNEVTGQTAAWLLLAGNVTVVISILMKFLSRYFPFKVNTINTIKRLNQLQKRHLMRFHYVLNPVALCMAAIHFALSSCRSSPLPEWGLICSVVMVFLGLVIKFRIGPKKMLRLFFRLHTGTASFSVMIVLLVVGHIIVD
ncbi:MAG: hypothetical protein V2J65_08850 [Desulfobacteraceae bacterium]|nr:hypothetical protein [Desulfobacteraceae bacterium]